MRETLQLTFKVVRDKSIKEAMVFAVYFSIFLLIVFEVRRQSVSLRSLRSLSLLIASDANMDQ